MKVYYRQDQRFVLDLIVMVQKAIGEPSNETAVNTFRDKGHIPGRAMVLSTAT